MLQFVCVFCVVYSYVLFETAKFRCSDRIRLNPARRLKKRRKKKTMNDLVASQLEETINASAICGAHEKTIRSAH